MRITVSVRATTPCSCATASDELEGWTNRRKSEIQTPPEPGGNQRTGGLYEGSGLGGATFCQQQGLSRSTFARYRKRQEQTVRKAAEGKRWLAVEVSSSAAVGSVSGLAVVLPSGRRIEVGRGFDADTLKRLLAVVGRG